MPDGEWARVCTCPGSGALREIEDRVKRDVAAHRARSEEVFRDIEVGRGKSPADIQREILAAYAAHGYEPPSDFSRWSRLLAAGTGRRGTRTLRLLIEGGRALNAAKDWSAAVTQDDRHKPEKDVPDVNPNWADDNNRKELAKMRRAFAAYAALAVATAALASITSGIVRIVFIVLALLFGAVAAWVGLWTLGVTALVGRRRR